MRRELRDPAFMRAKTEQAGQRLYAIRKPCKDAPSPASRFLCDRARWGGWVPLHGDSDADFDGL